MPRLTPKGKRAEKRLAAQYQRVVDRILMTTLEQVRASRNGRNGPYVRRAGRRTVRKRAISAGLPFRPAGAWGTEGRDPSWVILERGMPLQYEVRLRGNRATAKPVPRFEDAVRQARAMNRMERYYRPPVRMIALEELD